MIFVFALFVFKVCVFAFQAASGRFYWLLAAFTGHWLLLLAAGRFYWPLAGFWGLHHFKLPECFHTAGYNLFDFVRAGADG